MKTQHFDNVFITITCGEENAKVLISTSIFTDTGDIGSFYIPNNSRYNAQIIKARAKHDLGIIYSQSSLCIKNEIHTA